MAILTAPTFPPVVGESGGARVARIVRAFAGCSLSSRRGELAALVGRSVDDESIVEWRTNCATFALGVLAAAGCPYPPLGMPLPNGAAFGVLVNLGEHFGAWRVPAPSEAIPQGAALWYRVDGENDDHVEFLVEPLDLHGGGGRPDNAVTVGRGDVHASMGRPLWRWLEPAALGLPDAADDAPDPA